MIDILMQSWPLLTAGVLRTLELWLGALALSMPFGMLTGIIRCDRFRVPVLAPALDAVTVIARGVPIYVQVLIVYFVIPAALGINLNPFLAGILALGFCSSAYVSEIIRCGMNGVPAGQWEAASLLGFGAVTSIRYIIAPQMLRLSVPSLINEVIAVMKSTSILASIGALELTKMGQNIVARSMDPIPVYCAIAIIYLCMNAAISLAGKYVESRLNVATTK